MGMIYKRGNVWWCKYYVNGRPIRESTGTEKETGAKRFLKVREGRVAMGEPILRRADRIRYEEVAEDLRRFYREYRTSLVPRGRDLMGTFSGTSTPMAVDSQHLTVQNPWQGPVAQADRAEVS